MKLKQSTMPQISYSLQNQEKATTDHAIKKSITFLKKYQKELIKKKKMCLAEVFLGSRWKSCHSSAGYSTGTHLTKSWEPFESPATPASSSLPLGFASALASLYANKECATFLCGCAERLLCAFARCDLSGADCGQDTLFVLCL